MSAAQSINTFELPTTGDALAAWYKRDFAAMQKQYRRLLGKSLQAADITPLQLAEVANVCYPIDPLSIALKNTLSACGHLADISGHSGQAADKGSGHLIVRYADIADKRTTDGGQNLSDSGQADNMRTLQTEADNLRNALNDKDLSHQEKIQAYETELKNTRLELKKMAIERDDFEVKCQKYQRTLENYQADNSGHSDITKMLRTNYETALSELSQLQRVHADIEADNGKLADKLRTLKLEADKTTTTLTDNINALRTEADNLRTTIHNLETDLANARKRFSFKFKQLWNAELELINIASNALALYGFWILFEYVGILFVLILILFFKNTIKTVKSRKDRAIALGMNLAIFIEFVYGIFHYTTFFNILEPMTDKLIVPYPGLLAFFLAAVLSGFSIAALKQQQNLS